MPGPAASPPQPPSVASWVSLSGRELLLRKFFRSPLRTPTSALAGTMASKGGSWNSLTALQKVALLLGIPAGGAIVYILYRRYQESREERTTFVGEEELEIEMKVPRDAVKLLIGRQGANIKQLRKDTQARIDVDLEESGEERLLRISGSPVQVCRAKAAIHQLIAESLPVREELHVPQRAIGRIIGRGGQTVRAICQSTGARVDCSRDAEGSFSLTRLITLSGTRKEVSAAKQLIVEKLSEDDAFHRKVAQSVMVRTRRKQPLGMRKEEGAGDQGGPPCPNGEASRRPPSPPHQDGGQGDVPEYSPDEPQELRSEEESPEDSPSGTSGPSSAFELPSPDFSFHANEHLEVYVSAAESPNHFWVQIVGSRTLQLDKLTREMTQYYGSSDSLPETLDMCVGDIVAAPYLTDQAWYRARILGTLENGDLDLYYVDFGDNGSAPLEKLHPLRSDFLSLPFQAIECCLAGIAPAGDQWEEEALDEFDRLTHCSKWDPVMAKISSYLPSGSGTWLHVELYDTTGGQHTNIGEELVRLGYAKWRLQDDVGATGDGPHQTAKGAASTAFDRTLDNTTDMSLDSLLSDTQKTPDEMPLTLSCISLSGEPPEQLRHDAKLPAAAPYMEGCVSPLDSLQISTEAASCPSESPSLKAGWVLGGGGGCLGEGPPVGTAAYVKKALEAAPLPDIVAFGTEANHTSSPTEPAGSVAGSSPRLPSGEADMSLVWSDSSTCSPRGYFYYLSSSGEQADLLGFCRGSPSFDSSSQERPQPSSHRTYCLGSVLDSSRELRGSGEEEVASDGGDVFMLEEDSSTP
ncbi:hypothetical protein lerEdw1_010637 [Lerista edwardsae]|nr:hypothetical protein lerEdw1_010637 [Lerista edwardsae]